MTEQDYTVTWTIDVPAESPKEAAKKAAWIQRDKGSGALVFQVEDEDGNKETYDLWGEID